jgi:hypothetical protein
MRGLFAAAALLAGVQAIDPIVIKVRHSWTIQRPAC